MVSLLLSCNHIYPSRCNLPYMCMNTFFNEYDVFLFVNDVFVLVQCRMSLKVLYSTPSWFSYPGD